MSTPPDALPPLTSLPSGPPDLRDRVALVTGAARGIGRAIAEALAAVGATAVILDTMAADEAVAAIQAAGGQALSLTGSVAARADVERAIREIVSRHGRLDVLVNNAGIVERSSLEELDDETWQREIDVILKGTYLCTQAAYPVLQRQGGGKIVMISSISGKLGGALSSRIGVPRARSGPAYAAAKGGVISFTKWVAKDGGGHGIHCNCICPGPVESEMTRGYEYNVAAVPLGRMGSTRDVAQAAVFLGSQQSNFITGQTLNVDGGLLMD